MEEKKVSNADKVKALAESTIAECRQQGFAVREVQEFITYFEIELAHRRIVVEDELF